MNFSNHRSLFTSHFNLLQKFPVITGEFSKIFIEQIEFNKKKSGDPA